MILKLIKLLCFLGLHNYKTINIEFGFNPTDRVTTLECKNCGFTKINNLKCQNYDFEIDKITVLFEIT